MLLILSKIDLTYLLNNNLARHFKLTDTPIRNYISLLSLLLVRRELIQNTIDFSVYVCVYVRERER